MTFKGKSSSSKDAEVSQVEEPENNRENIETGLSPYQFELNVFDMARVILKKRKPVIGITMTLTIILAVFLFLKPNLYTSTATILPSGNSGDMSAISSIVGGLEGRFPTADENSSALFPLILRSNLIVDAVLEKEYTFTHDSEEKTLGLVKYLGSDNPDRLRQNLRDITTIKSDKKTGEIYVGIESKYPAFSQAVLKEYLAQLEDFNLHKRGSSARENVRYLANQLQLVNEDLKNAEDNLETFQKANLDWDISTNPEILKEMGRLRRNVDAKSTTYAVLIREHEMAKLEAQKDIPIIRILDTPSLPTMKSGPFRRNIILLSGIIVFMMTSFAFILKDMIRKVTDETSREDYDALQSDLQTVFPRTRKVINRLKTSVLEKTPLIKSKI
jgi:uncharacterized protein involved in exopolysaccharide biosynthesis